jgi:mannose-6-phosphate isomerase-like protein (cupin superfamily)
MPIYPPGQWLNAESRPASAGPATAGRFSVPLAGARFDRHHHDVDEIWFVGSGSMKMLLEGSEEYVQAGDIVFSPAGLAHDIVEVYEPVTGFFSETGHPLGGRTGHLHESDADAAGHDVPAMPLPADFPVRAPSVSG